MRKKKQKKCEVTFEDYEAIEEIFKTKTLAGGLLSPLAIFKELKLN